MTCILGMRTEGATYLACDGRVQMGGAIVTESCDKVRVWAPGVLVALSGSMAALSILELIPDRQATSSPAAIMAAMRKALRDEAWPNSSNSGAPTYDIGGFLATVHDLHGICSSLNIMPLEFGKVLGFGSGGDHGAGAASLALKMGAEPAEALRLGVLEAAEAISNCGGKITVWELSVARGIRKVENFKRLRKASWAP